MSRGCFAPIGYGHISRDILVRTFEGQTEREIGFASLFRRRMLLPSLTMGNTITDTGDVQIEEVSVQKNPDTMVTKIPKNIIFNDGTDIQVKYQKEMVDRMSPYIDDGAGIMFPSPQLGGTKAPNAVIGQIDGRTEASVLMGYVQQDLPWSREIRIRPVLETSLVGGKNEVI